MTDADRISIPLALEDYVKTEQPPKPHDALAIDATIPTAACNLNLHKA
jgi:hypothetical protein